MTMTDPGAGNPSPDAGEAATTPQATEGQPATDAAKPEGEGTTDGTKPGDAGKQGDDKGGDGQPEGAPETYEAFTLPEGVKLEGERLTNAQGLFKELNLSQAQAQRLVDEFVKVSGDDVSALTGALEAQRQQQIETWGQQAKESLGAKYDETVNLARTAVQHVNDPELTEAFNALGWGNHPALIRAFAKFGEAMRDSKVEGAGGETATASDTPLQNRMYPGMK